MNDDLKYNIKKRNDKIKSEKRAITELNKVLTFLTMNKVNLVPELLIKPFNKVQSIFHKDFKKCGSVSFHPGFLSHLHVFLGDSALLSRLSPVKTKRSKEVTVINGTFDDAPLGIVYHNWNDEDSTQFIITNSKLTCRYNGRDQKHVVDYFIMYLRVAILTIRFYIKHDEKVVSKQKNKLYEINLKYNIVHHGKYSWSKVFHNK